MLLKTANQLASLFLFFGGIAVAVGLVIVYPVMYILDNFGRWVGQALGFSLKTFLSLIAGPIVTIVNGLIDVLQVFLDSSETVFKIIKDLIKSLQDVFDVALEALQLFVREATAIMNGILDTIKEFVETLKGIGEDSVEAVTGAAEDAGEAIEGASQAVAQSALAVGDAVADATDEIDRFGQEGVSKIGEEGARQIAEIAAFMDDALNEVANFGSDRIEDVANVFGSFGGLENTFNNKLQGKLSNMTNQVNQVVSNAVGNAWNDFKGRVKRKFGIG